MTRAARFAWWPGGWGGASPNSGARNPAGDERRVGHGVAERARSGAGFAVSYAGTLEGYWDTRSKNASPKRDARPGSRGGSSAAESNRACVCRRLCRFPLHKIRCIRLNRLLVRDFGTGGGEYLGAGDGAARARSTALERARGGRRSGPRSREKSPYLRCCEERVKRFALCYLVTSFRRSAPSNARSCRSGGRFFRESCESRDRSNYGLRCR